VGLAVQRIWLLLGGCGLFGCFLVGLGLLSNRSGGPITPLSGFTIFEPSGSSVYFDFNKSSS
jgi:hypothetical protein